MDVELLRLLTKTNTNRTKVGLKPLGLDEHEGQVRLLERHNRKPFIKEWCSWTTVDQLKKVLKKNESN